MATLFRRRVGGNAGASPGDDPQLMAEGKALSPSLIKELCVSLGYDFELFADQGGQVYRFRRIPPKTDRDDGDVW